MGGGDRNEFDDPMGKYAAGDEEEDEEEEDGKEDESAKTGGSWLKMCTRWHQWKGYSSANELYCADTEYFAIRNATAVFDLTPMTKYRITGPDALEYLNRLVTRDMAKVAPGE